MHAGGLTAQRRRHNDLSRIKRVERRALKEKATKNDDEDGSSHALIDDK
jgi:hypothetical protein